MTRTWMMGLATLVVASAPVYGQWANPGDEHELTGKTVVDVGTVRAASKLEPPAPTATRNPLAPPPFVRTTYFLEFRGSRVICFFDDRSAKRTESAALLLTESDARNLLLATLEPSPAGVQVMLRQVQRIPCP